MTDLVAMMREIAPHSPIAGNLLKEAADEIERMRLQLENQKAEWLAWDEKRIALERDAARYRWLRDNPWPPILEADILLHRNARWDAAIDAAMKR